MEVFGLIGLIVTLFSLPKVLRQMQGQGPRGRRVTTHRTRRPAVRPRTRRPAQRRRRPRRDQQDEMYWSFEEGQQRPLGPVVSQQSHAERR